MGIVGSIIKEGKFYLDTIPIRRRRFSDVLTLCISDTQKDTANFLEITKLDYQNKIILGRFQFIAVSPLRGCDTIKATQGRFDLKL